MIISEAAQRVLNMLDLEDGDEYGLTQALIHVQQAIFELSEENEFGFGNRLTTAVLETPDADAIPAYWDDVPGRAPLTDVISASWSEFGYIKKGWISVENQQQPFRQMGLIELMNRYGDYEGVPESYAIDGDYFYWRPIAPEGTDYTIRLSWVSMPTEGAPGEEPRLLAQVPYGVIYRACMIACLWTGDDTRVPMFGQLSADAFEKYNARNSMNNDEVNRMEEYNG